MRIGLLILFLLASNILLYAQEKMLKIDFGLSFGGSLSTFEGSEIDNRLDPYYSPDARMESVKNFTASFQTKLTLKNYFFLRQYISYFEKGGTEINTRFSYPVDARLTYLSLPILAGFQPLNVGNTGWFTVYVEGGIVPNFMLNIRSDDIKKGYLSEPTINNFVWSYQVGAGLELKITDKWRLFGNYQYVKDITPFFEVFKDSPDYRREIINVTKAIQLGMIINVR